MRKAKVNEKSGFYNESKCTHPPTPLSAEAKRGAHDAVY
jgi:hypothetical protein